MKSKRDNFNSILSWDDKVKFIENYYPVGSVLYFKHKAFGDSEEEKYVVLTYLEDSVIYCLKINSNVSKYHKKLKKENNYTCILAKDYSFLRHSQSFINCMDVYTIPINDIIPQFENLFKGQISNQALSDISKVIERLDDMTPDLQKKLLLSLKSYIIS